MVRDASVTTVTQGGSAELVHLSLSSAYEVKPADSDLFMLLYSHSHSFHVLGPDSKDRKSVV